MTTPTRFHIILDLVFAHGTADVKVSVLKRFPASDKPSAPVCTHQAVCSYMWTLWEEIPSALKTIDRPNFCNRPTRRTHQVNFTLNCLIPAIACPLRSPNINPRSLIGCQLQIKLLKAQKTFNRTGGFLLLMQQEFLILC